MKATSQVRLSIASAAAAAAAVVVELAAVVVELAAVVELASGVSFCTCACGWALF